MVLLACRAAAPVAAGPAPAEIVEGRVEGAVQTDTIRDGASISVSRARWTLQSRPQRQLDFWSNVAALDVASAERVAQSLDEKTFAAALRSLMASDPDAAAVAFTALYGRAGDAFMRLRARVGLTIALSWRPDWSALSRLPEVEPDSSAAPLDPMVVQAGVERWARALAALPAQTVHIPEGETVLPLRRSAFGTPVVTVRLNGRSYQFWFDTGASMTLISASIAREAGVRLASPDSLALGVIAGHIPARAIFIDSLGLGPVMARGLSAALVNPDALRLDLRNEKGIRSTVSIDGVIGTDLMRHMDIVLDARDGTITIRRPRRNPRAERNLFWMGYPVVRFITRDGRPVLFGLDTGAEVTYVTSALLRKMPKTSIAARIGALSGLGSETQRTEWVARSVALSDGDHAIDLRNIPVVPERRWTFVTVDGVIGSDVALASRMHLDFTNGIFDVRRSAAPLVKVAP